MTDNATLAEQLVCLLASELHDSDVVFTGLVTGEQTAFFAAGIPVAAAVLAQKTHAPNLTMILAGWIVNPDLTALKQQPTSEFDPILLDLPAEAHSQRVPGVMNFQRGDITVGFSSAAQMDRHGSLNTHRIHLPNGSTRSLVGPILIPEHMTVFGREIVMMPRHERRTFAEAVDYRSGPRLADQRRLASKFGYTGAGPVMVITPRCVFDFDDDAQMRVRSLHDGNSLEDVQAHTGFSVPSADVPQTMKADDAYLEILRNEVDPHGVLLGSLGSRSA